MSHYSVPNSPTPLFSIITVTWNAISTLPVTMQSVAAQTFRSYEHLIIDGRSTDGTVEYASSHLTANTLLRSEPDNGLYDAMNKGIQTAKGKYLIFLNAGDTFHSPDTLAKIAEAAGSLPTPDIIYGQTDIVDSHRHRIADRHLIAPEHLTPHSFADGMVVCHQAFIARRDIAGEFDTSYRYSADYEWCIRCLLASHSNHYIPATLIDYLMEGVSTANRRASLSERFTIMRRYYGLPLTVVRHLAFVPRFLARRRLERKAIAKISKQDNK